MERFNGDYSSATVCKGEHEIQVYYCEDSDPYFMAYCVKCGYNFQDLPVRIIDEVFKK